jgi:predicted CxxxxCH...CXXCH cytochrome family protein
MRHLPTLAAVLALAGCGSAREGPLAGGQGGEAEQCARCHGSAESFAPPPSVAGVTTAAERPVGAHGAHANPGPVARRGLPCSECHVVPRTVNDEGHLARDLVVFGPLASAGGARPAFDRGAGTCANVYCHGVTLRAPSNPGPLAWTFQQAAGAERCAFCHGFPPPPPHVSGVVECAPCHSDSVQRGNVILPDGLHLDGKVDATCGACHPLPPASGAHLAHAAEGALYGDLRTAGPGAPSYAFGCGHCHPTDGAKHFDGVIQVELAEASPATAGTLKALADPAAAYDRAAGTCSGTYCHSSGQAAPVFATTPGWRSGATLGCGGCHGNPPKGATQGADSARPNSHVYVKPDAGGTPTAAGHFGGWPSWYHAGAHGETCADGAGAALPCGSSPITCQACHFDTADGTATGPSGFYWLHTTGDLDLGAGVVTERCDRCHGALAGAPPPVDGVVRPELHVNGERDVRLDPRSSLTVDAGYAFPAGVATPQLPYWVAPAILSLQRPFLARNGSPDGFTLSTHLADATYDPATRTCSSVACHLEWTAGLRFTDGSPVPEARWGDAPKAADGGCRRCHATLFFGGAVTP